MWIESWEKFDAQIRAFLAYYVKLSGSPGSLTIILTLLTLQTHNCQNLDVFCSLVRILMALKIRLDCVPSFSTIQNSVCCCLNIAMNNFLLIGVYAVTTTLLLSFSLLRACGMLLLPVISSLLPCLLECPLPLLFTTGLTFALNGLKSFLAIVRWFSSS